MKEKIIEVMHEKIIPAIDRFSEHHLVKAMVAGVMAPMSIMVVGSFITILMSPPVPTETTNAFLLAWKAWAANNMSWLNLAYTFTMNAIAIYTILGFVIALTKIKKIQPTNYIILALAAFLILCTNVSSTDAGNVVSLSYFGASGLFSAIIISMVVVELADFLKRKGLDIKLPASVPSNVAEPIENIFVNIAIIVLVILLRLFLNSRGVMLPQLINLLFAPLLSASDTLGAAVIWIFLLRGLWFFGIHGDNATGAIMTPILMSNLSANIEAYAAGEPIPYILTNSFNNLINLGMLPLAIAILLVCKSKQLKVIGRIGLVPSIFGIGEPLTFGVPIVLNFKLLIPYILGFEIATVGQYLLTSWGWINRTVATVPWSLPGPVKAFLSTYDWRAVVSWTVFMVIAVALYIPFLKSYDRELLKAELEAEE